MKKIYGIEFMIGQGYSQRNRKGELDFDVN